MMSNCRQTLELGTQCASDAFFSWFHYLEGFALFYFKNQRRQCQLPVGWSDLCLPCQEYLLDFPTCIRTYQVAVTSAEDFLGADHPLTKKFKRTLKKALRDEEAAAHAPDRAAQQRQKQTKYKCGEQPRDTKRDNAEEGVDNNWGTSVRLWAQVLPHVYGLRPLGVQN